MILIMLGMGQKMAEGTNWYLIVPLVIIILAVGITLAIKNTRRQRK